MTTEPILFPQVGTRLGFENADEFHWRDNADLNEVPIYSQKKSKQKKEKHRLLPKILSRLMSKRSNSKNTLYTEKEHHASDGSTGATESTAASDDSIRSMPMYSVSGETATPTTLSHAEEAVVDGSAEYGDDDAEYTPDTSLSHGKISIPAEHHLAETLKAILSGKEQSKAEFHMASTPWHWIVSDEEAVELVLLEDSRDDLSCTPTIEIDPVKDICLEDEIPLMEQRLLATGLVGKDDYEFIQDEDSEVVDSSDYHASNVKTGVWEVTTFDGEEEGPTPTTSYIVTAIRMTDHVDTKKLRKAVFGVGQQHKRRPKVSMAPTDIAERMVGFSSGTMAPICHSKDMYLYLEESILDTKIPLDHQWLRVGCGIFGQCLSIRADKFVEIAKTSGGMEECSLIRIKKKKSIKPVDKQ